MFRHNCLAAALTLSLAAPAQAQISDGSAGSVETVVVTAKAIDNAPGGENTLLNQVILQAPGAAQDSFGQLHIRGEHNGLQYRLNGIIIPEGISVFGQTLDSRLANSVKLITGALPAEYGNRTGGVIDVQTKTGVFEPGGQVGIYGGSQGEINPSIGYGGSSGGFNYFVSADWQTNTLGIEAPDGSSDPLHDRTKQWHGFAYLQDIVDQNSSVTAILGTSNGIFQLPNTRGLQPSGIDGIIGLGPLNLASGNFVLNANSQTAFASDNLDERQREITHYAILSYLHAQGPFDFQLSLFGRYSSLFFTPGANAGDILFNGIAQTAYKRDEAYGLQAEAAYHFGDTHTIRFGALYQGDDLSSRTSSLVLATAAGGAGNSNPNPLCLASSSTCQTATVPLAIADNGTKHAWSYGFYVQDEWKALDGLTINYGVRFDEFAAFDAESQISPRVNLVWTPSETTTVHAGFSRYFSPPPIELVATTDIALFDNTTAAADHTDTTPKAERADYYDLGVNQMLMEGLAIGVDGFYKASHNLVDEGQFGAPIILTPFNYQSGRQYGVEFTGSYERAAFSGYINAAYGRAVGRNIVTSEFQFNPADRAYIATHFIPLDHQQSVTVSAGASYSWETFRFSADLLYGSGLRRDGATPNGEHVPEYAQVNLGMSRTFDCLGVGGLTARLDVINLFDAKYQIRDGSGVGVGAPQFGPRRGFFVGLSMAL